MKWRKRTLDEIADMICGNGDNPFLYRSSMYLSRFFEDANLPNRHDGSTRIWWVSSQLEEILQEPHANAHTPPPGFARLIKALMDVGDAVPNDTPDRPAALELLNRSLQREGFEAFYASDKQCYLRHVGTGTIAALPANPHRPFSKDELQRRDLLAAYFDRCSEDDLIGKILLPLFRQLGYERVSAAGHKDKALEYGKDVWMRFQLPTQHMIYFGLQVKRDKLDASGVSKNGTANVAEILNQVAMMLGHEIFDPETNRRVLVDHAYIIAGGEITNPSYS